MTPSFAVGATVPKQSRITIVSALQGAVPFASFQAAIVKASQSAK